MSKLYLGKVNCDPNIIYIILCVQYATHNYIISFLRLFLRQEDLPSLFLSFPRVQFIDRLPTAKQTKCGEKIRRSEGNYGGANETRYGNDIEDVVDEVFGRPNPARTVNSAFFASTRLLTLQTRLSAAYKGIMALLYKQKCRDFMNDTTIDIVNSMLESPDIHHIFPEAYCRAQNIDRTRYNSIVNKTPILPATNRSIGGNAPSEYIAGILKKVQGLDEQTLKARIESHCINYDFLVHDDFDHYFVDRARKLLDLIESAMEKPVSDRNAEITVKQFGASLQ